MKAGKPFEKPGPYASKEAAAAADACPHYPPGPSMQILPCCRPRGAREAAAAAGAACLEEREPLREREREREKERKRESERERRSDSDG
jgi:hypothetical protein